MAARVAYWNNYVLSLVGPNAPNVPPNPLPTIDTPVLIPDPNVPYYFNGPMPTLFEPGHGVLVGFGLTAAQNNPGSVSYDPEEWVCVYAKVIKVKRQKRNYYKKGPRPLAGDRRRVQLRAKKITFNHEPLSHARAWRRNDNTLIAEGGGDFIPLTWYEQLGDNKADKIDEVENRAIAWAEDPDNPNTGAIANWAHLQLVRAHGISPQPPL